MPLVGRDQGRRRCWWRLPDNRNCALNSRSVSAFSIPLGHHQTWFCRPQHGGHPDPVWRVESGMVEHRRAPRKPRRFHALVDLDS